MQLFMRMGILKVVTSDQGTEFNNQLNEEFMRLLNIDHRLSTPYHPQVSVINIICITLHIMLLLLYIYRQMVWWRGLIRPYKRCWSNS